MDLSTISEKCQDEFEFPWMILSIGSKKIQVFLFLVNGRILTCQHYSLFGVFQQDQFSTLASCKAHRIYLWDIEVAHDDTLILPHTKISMLAHDSDESL